MHISECQITTALVPTPCFLVQSTTIAETFWHLICTYLLCDWRIVVRGQRSGQPWLGPGLVRVVCALPSLLNSSLQSPETLRMIWCVNCAKNRISFTVGLLTLNVSDWNAAVYINQSEVTSITSRWLKSE